MVTVLLIYVFLAGRHHIHVNITSSATILPCLPWLTLYILLGEVIDLAPQSFPQANLVRLELTLLRRFTAPSSLLQY
jgi:hypothetical protein